MEQEAHNKEQNKGLEPISPFWRNRLKYILPVIFVLFLFGYFAGPPSDFPLGETIVTVTPGQSLKSIGTMLLQKHLIRSQALFSTLVTLFGEEKNIPSGDYYFDRPAGVLSVAKRIAFGNHNLEQIKVTIPEGETVREVAVLLAQKIPNFDQSAFIAYASPHEGYLFPETYFVYPKTSPQSIADQMLAMFDKETAQLFATPSPTHSKSDVVIMASLIEREAHGSDDRAIISSILWNRISLGMRLQVDATVAYAVGKPDSGLTRSDLTIDSPYNTYLHKGLPPGPIASPGILALTAAQNPAKTPYLYYLHDKNGTIHYAKTYAEHLLNIKRYLK